MSGFPARSCSTLGRRDRMRVPWPAASTTPTRVPVLGGSPNSARLVTRSEESLQSGIASQIRRDQAARRGLEPRLTDPKSAVLPLDDRAPRRTGSRLSVLDAGGQSDPN